ncbi:MAG: hypothetical protein ACFE8A_10615 [Candidatus Hodarchaeota archaeon]
MIKVNDKNFEELDIVKKYFSRIYTVLDAKIRERLKNLNVSEEKKKILLKELAFLNEEKQTEYLDELFIIWNKIFENV